MAVRRSALEGVVMFGGAYRGARVLVTGHTGFKGSWLCQWLLDLGAEVSGLALAPETAPHLFGMLGLEQRIHHHLVDVRDADGILAVVRRAEPEFVFHLAAQPLVRRSYVEPKATFDINVGGTVNLLEAVRATPSVRSCVVATTDKCYENREWEWGYRESDHLGGHDPYSASKAAAELAIASWRRSFQGRGCARLASARAGNVIGGGDWSADRLVPDFVAALMAGQPLALRNPHATRPWQHVLEPLSAYLHLGARLARHDGADVAEAWNIGPGERSVVTVERLARLLVDAWGQGEVVCAPPTGHPHEAGLLKLDCSKAASRLGWHPIWDIATTVAKTADWYRSCIREEDMIGITREQIHTYEADAGREGSPWTTTRSRTGDIDA
jgi:CDP-glucose 4,6-dehydratase